MKVLLGNLLKELGDEQLDKVKFNVEQVAENLIDLCISIYASNQYSDIGKKLLQRDIKGVEWLLTSFIYCARNLSHPKHD